MADPDDQPHYRAERLPPPRDRRPRSHRDYIDEAKHLLAEAVARNPYAGVVDLSSPAPAPTDGYITATAADVGAYDTVWVDGQNLWRQVVALETPPPGGQVGWFFFDDVTDEPVYHVAAELAVYVIKAPAS